MKKHKNNRVTEFFWETMLYTINSAIYYLMHEYSIVSMLYVISQSYWTHLYGTSQPGLDSVHHYWFIKVTHGNMGERGGGIYLKMLEWLDKHNTMAQPINHLRSFSGSCDNLWVFEYPGYHNRLSQWVS